LPTSAVALALGAAVLHAVWNMRLARAADTEAATAVTLAAGVLLLTLPALVTWRVDAAAWPYVAGSCAFEIGYIVTLAAGLRRGDLSVVYPLARGSAPVLVLAVSAGVLGAATSAWQVSGVLLVAIGVLLVRGLRRPADPGVIALALACGACIAGYTLVDARGIEHAAAMPYLWVVLAVTALVYVPLVARWRGGGALNAELGWGTLVTGALFCGAYLLVLAALRLAEPGPVAAVRESSVVIAAALGFVVLHEPVTGARAAGALLVAAGVAVVALA